jgi:hypothetical protein
MVRTSASGEYAIFIRFPSLEIPLSDRIIDGNRHWQHPIILIDNSNHVSPRSAMGNEPATMPSLADEAAHVVGEVTTSSFILQ